MKLALVHDYLSQDGGAERVLLALQNIWPEAPTYVWFYNKKNFTGVFEGKDIRTSFIQNLPFGVSHYQWYLPLLPMATERHDLSEFDVVVSSASSFAKGVITRPDTLHICYCHTPTRYLWTDTHEYIERLPYNALIKKLVIPPVISRLRLWDQLSTTRVDHFVANSHTVAARIWKYYRRESAVIYPPVDLTHFAVAPATENYFVTGGRLVPYKKMDLVIRVFNRLKWPLKIFGTGPELKRLRDMARPNIEFLGKISDEEKARLMARAQAFIHPQVEDFGITPIESMAAGRPVIALSKGGALETVVPDKTGVFFHRQTWEDLLDTVLHFDPSQFNAEEIRAHALQFGTKQFAASMQRFVLDRYEEFQKGLYQPTLLQKENG
ncbi:MAG: glycosyltransferase [Patescibacteria group bacterium]